MIASGNPHKVSEIAVMLEPLALRVSPQPADLEVEETGLTYADNARLKASAAALRTGHWSLADDSGIEVDALGGAPGVYSARYAPTDRERVARLLQELGQSPYRGACFRSAMALADPGGRVVLEADGVCRGRVLHAPRGHGPGYDTIFYVREAAASYAEMGDHQRLKYGSRGKAARAMAPRLRKLMGL